MGVYILDRCYILIVIILIIPIVILNIVSTPVDLWWHLQIGKDILNGLWPSPDIYSFISNSNWVVHSWLADVVFYFLYSVGELINHSGIYFIYVFRFIILFLFAICIYKESYRLLENHYLSIICYIFACSSIWHMEPRPYLFSPIFFMLFYNYLKREKPKYRDWIILPAIMILWVNIHGAYIIITAILFISILLNIIISILYPKYVYYKLDWFILSFVVILCTLINPHPIQLLNRIIYANSYPSADWNSLLWWLLHYPGQVSCNILFYILIFLIWCISLYLLSTSRLYVPIAILISDVVCLYLAFSHVRLIWLTNYVCLSIIYIWYKHLSWKDYLNQVKINYLAIFVLFLSVLISMKKIPVEGVYKLPIDVIQYLNENKLYGNTITPWHWSGYITWMTNKQSQILVDTRIEPFSYQQIKDHLFVLSYPLQSIEILKTWEVQYIMVPKDERFIEWKKLEINNHLDILFQDDFAILAKLRY